MKRNILTALDTIEENIRYVREQLDMDVSALTSAASVAGTFHGAQEILREHALKIKQELPDVIRDVCVWFCTDIDAEQCNAVAQNYFNAISDDGSRSPDVDNIYTYFAGLVRSAGVKGASLSFEDLTDLYWVAFQDMYQTAIRDLRKTTVEIPEMMVTVYSSHIDDKFDENPRINRLVAAYAYDGLLNDELALNKFLDEVYAKVNAVRLTDGVSLDGFMVTCPEVVGYQLWAVRTGGFPALMGTRVEAVLDNTAVDAAVMQDTPDDDFDEPAALPAGPLDVLANLNIGRSSELLNFARQCIAEHEERNDDVIDLDEAIQLQLITTTEVQPKAMLVTFKVPDDKRWLYCVALYSPDSYLAATRACIDYLTACAIKDGVHDQLTAIEVTDYHYPDDNQ